MSGLLVAYGHSWVDGDGATAIHRRMVEQVAALLGLRADNRGVGGSASRHTAALVRAERPPPATAYLLMTGLNDLRLHGDDARAIDAYGAAARTVVEACLAAASDATTLVLEQPPLHDYSKHAPHDRGSTALVRSYNQRLHNEVGGQRGVVMVRVADWDPATMLDDDTVHPNDFGHATIAAAAAAAYRASSMGSTSPVHD